MVRFDKNCHFAKLNCRYKNRVSEKGIVLCKAKWFDNKPNSLRFNVPFSFMILRHLLFYSASNPGRLAANEATVSSFDIKRRVNCGLRGG